MLVELEDRQERREQDPGHDHAADDQEQRLLRGARHPGPWGLAGGLSPRDGAYMANLAASVVVAKLGTYAVSRDELMKVLKGE